MLRKLHSFFLLRQLLLKLIVNDEHEQAKKQGGDDEQGIQKAFDRKRQSQQNGGDDEARIAHHLVKFVGVEKRKEQQYHVGNDQNCKKLLKKHIVNVFEGCAFD